MNKDNEYSLEDILAEYSSVQTPNRAERPASRRQDAVAAQPVSRRLEKPAEKPAAKREMPDRGSNPEVRRPEKEQKRKNRGSFPREDRNQESQGRTAKSGKKPQKKAHGRARPKSAIIGLVFVLLSLAGMAWGLMNLQEENSAEKEQTPEETVELRLAEAVEAQLDEMKDSVLHPRSEEP